MNCAFCGRQVDRGTTSLLTGKHCCTSPRCKAKSKTENQAINESYRKAMSGPVVIKDIATISDIDSNLLPIVGILIRSKQYRHPVLSLKSSPVLIYNSIRDVFIDYLPEEYIRVWNKSSYFPFARSEKFKIIKLIPKDVIIETLSRFGLQLYKTNIPKRHMSDKVHQCSLK
jgi:hypothetical protein